VIKGFGTSASHRYGCDPNASVSGPAWALAPAFSACQGSSFELAVGRLGGWQVRNCLTSFGELP
jgi:hypothetical protein